MAVFERQGYIPPSDKFPNELRLRPELYENLQMVAPEGMFAVNNELLDTFANCATSSLESAYERYMESWDGDIDTKKV